MWLQPILWLLGGAVSQVEQVRLSRVGKGLLSSIYREGPKTEGLASVLRRPWASGCAQVSSSALLESRRGRDLARSLSARVLLRPDLGPGDVVGMSKESCHLTRTVT